MLRDIVSLEVLQLCFAVHTNTGQPQIKAACHSIRPTASARRTAPQQYLSSLSAGVVASTAATAAAAAMMDFSMKAIGAMVLLSATLLQESASQLTDCAASSGTDFDYEVGAVQAIYSACSGLIATNRKPISVVEDPSLRLLPLLPHLIVFEYRHV